MNHNLYSGVTEKELSRNTLLEVWRMNVSFDDLDNLSRALNTPRPSEWILSPLSG